jgi:uncharacterized phage-like protein YoqJ
MSGCSFTGHRQIEYRHSGSLGELVARAIAYVYGEGCRDFYLGGAIGFDTVAAQQVLLFRMSHPDVTLNLVLPCKNQTENWNDRQREMYDYLLSQADTVEYISEDYTRYCMSARNRRLVELCDVLIAYVGHDRSGSSQTKRMAESAGKTVYNLYPTLERQ